MRRRRTSKFQSRPEVKTLQARVTSSRIVFYDTRKAMLQTLKWALVLSILGALGFAGWLGIKRGLLESDEFCLRELVINDNPVMDEIQFFSVTGVRLDASLFQLQPRRIRATLEQQPEISRAKVVKIFPGRLEVTITPRSPEAWIASATQEIPPRDPRRGLLVDSKGILFPCRTAVFHDAVNLPVIEITESQLPLKAGDKLEQTSYWHGIKLLRAAIAADPAAAEWIDTIRPYKAWGSEMITRRGTAAVFGHRDLAKEMKNFLLAMRHARAQGKELASIKLIGRRNIPVVIRDADGDVKTSAEALRVEEQESTAPTVEIEVISQPEAEPKEDAGSANDKLQNNLDLQELLKR